MSADAEFSTHKSDLSITFSHDPVFGLNEVAALVIVVTESSFTEASFGKLACFYQDVKLGDFVKKLCRGVLTERFGGEFH